VHCFVLLEKHGLGTGCCECWIGHIRHCSDNDDDDGWMEHLTLICSAYLGCGGSFGNKSRVNRRLVSG
jgi:hypothetical protein